MKVFFIELGILLVILLLIIGFNSPIGGIKIGKLIEVSRKGFFRTCEAKIISDGDFYFTIRSEEECKRAESFLGTDTAVLVTYEKPLFYSRFNTESGVYGVVN